MFIRSIHLENFRNYGRLDLDVGPSVNIFYGNNAQGKTNLVEGIYVASSIASHRTSKDQDLIKFGENEYKTSLDLTDDDGSNVQLSSCFYTERSALSRNGRSGRLLVVDNAPADKISEYIGICNIVIFAPEDLNIVKNAPSYHIAKLREHICQNRIASLGRHLVQIPVLYQAAIKHTAR